MSDDKKEILRVFVQEASDKLDVLDALLMQIEDDPHDRERLIELMRSAHTLKGSAGVAGVAGIAELAHVVETAVEKLKEGQIAAGPKVLDHLAHSLEEMHKSLAAVDKGEAEPESINEQRENLRAWLTGQDGFAKQQREQPAMGGQLELGEYDLLRMKVLKQQGKSIFRVDSAVELGDATPSQWMTQTLAHARRAGVVVASDPVAAQAEKLLTNGNIALLIGTEMTADGLEKHLRSGTALCPTVTAVSWAKPAGGENDAPERSRALVSDRTVRVDLQVLNDLLRLVGELMLSRDSFAQTSEHIAAGLRDVELGRMVSESAAQLGHLSSQLQDAIMDARMVPVLRLFLGVKRAARGAARRAGGSVSFETHSEKMEIDKSVSDVLAQPLANFASAVVAWGLEAPSVESVAISMRAERRWNQVVFGMEVDLPGIPQEARAVLESAVTESGGRTEVVELSGRSQITIVLPLTLSIIRVMMVEVGSEVFALPVESVHETVRVRRDEIEHVKGTPVIQLRRTPLSLVFLRELLRVPQSAVSDLAWVLVVRHGSKEIGVTVDRLLGIREVVLKPLSSRFAAICEVSGSTILGDGRIALILNTEAVAREALTHASLHGATPEAAVHAQQEVLR